MAESAPVVVTDRFDYPDSAEQGATLFREFNLFDGTDGTLASGTTATLIPAGSCEAPEAGTLSCSIPTAALPLATHDFQFESAIHEGEDVLIDSWPVFSVDLVERSVKTRLQLAADAKAQGSIGIFASISAISGFALELLGTGDLQSDAFAVETSSSEAFGSGFSGGIGGSFEFGPVEPRGGARFKIGGELRQYEKAAIQLDDLSNPQQLGALAAFLLNTTPTVVPAVASAPVGPTAALLAEALIYAFNAVVVDTEMFFQPFLTKSKSGGAWTGTASGFVGAFTSQRTNFDPFDWGLGARGAASVALGVEDDLLSGETHVVFRGVPQVGGTFDLALLRALLALAGEGDFLPGVSGNALLSFEARFTFAGDIDLSSLTKLTFQVVPQTVVNSNIEKTTVTLVFESDDLAASFLRFAPAFFVIPPTNLFDLVRIVSIAVSAIDSLEGMVTVTELQGNGIGSTAGLGIKADLGGTIGLSFNLGAEARLTSSMRTQEWMIQRSSLVQVSDFPFEDPLAEEKRFVDAVQSSLQFALDSAALQLETIAVTAGTVASTIIGRITEATLGAIETAATFFDAAGDAIGPTLDATLSVLGTAFDSLTGSSALRSAQAANDPFFVSELVDVAPAGVTVDPPLPLTISYPADFAGDPQTLRIFQRRDDGSWVALPSSADEEARSVSTTISALGLFVVAADLAPPTITFLSQVDEVQALLGDADSGIDAASVTLLLDGVAVASNFDPALGVLRHDGPIAADVSAEIIVSDGAGNEGRAAAVIVAAQRVANLVEGWNLVGWTGDAPVAEAVAPIIDAVQSVFTWDATAQGFLLFDPSGPAFVNSLDQLRQGDGVWVNMGSNSGVWTQPSLSGPRDVPLEADFNLVFWSGPSGTSVVEAIAGIGDAVDVLFLWAAASQQFLSFNSALPIVLNTATTLNNGDGVWIRVDRSLTWIQPG